MTLAVLQTRPAQALFGTMALLLAAIGALTLYWFDPVSFHFYPVCPFHQLTGLHCPGCGTLRALHQLLHGHIVAALRFNALFVLSLPFLGGYVARVVSAKMAGRCAPSIQPAWLWLGLGVLIAFGILRNLPFPPFAWLAPTA